MTHDTALVLLGMLVGVLIPGLVTRIQILFKGEYHCKHCGQRGPLEW